MNFISDRFLWVIFTIILRMTCNIVGQDPPPFEVCPNAPTNLQTVHAEVYFNGCTFNDDILFGRICTWAFSDDDVSVTFKVGAEVTFENDKWICHSDVKYDCNCAFQYACLAQLLDQKTLMEFICCAQKKGNYEKLVNKCIKKYKLKKAVADCVNGLSGCDPKQILLDNSKIIRDSGVDLSYRAEPFIFFEQTYDDCTSHTGVDWWAQSVCKMLTEEKFNQLEQCQEAFGLN